MLTKGLVELRLPKGYSGQVTLGTGNWTIQVRGSNMLESREYSFHELAEVTIEQKKQPYMRKDESGAHKMAQLYAWRYNEILQLNQER
jgi:hypothetical protein